MRYVATIQIGTVVHNHDINALDGITSCTSTKPSFYDSESCGTRIDLGSIMAQPGVNEVLKQLRTDMYCRL